MVHLARRVSRLARKWKREGAVIVIVVARYITRLHLYYCKNVAFFVEILTQQTIVFELRFSSFF